MKKKLLSIITILSFLLLPITVFAEDEYNTLSGPELTSPGSTITYDLKVKTPTTIKKYDADLTYETNVLELLSIENGESWKGNNKLGESPLELHFDSNGVTGSTTVAKLKFKVKDGATKAETRISIVGKYTEDDDTIKNLEEYAKTVQIKSTDNTLKDLKVNNETVVNFSPTTYSYSIQVEPKVTSADIQATLNNNTASFVDKYGPRNVPLEYGDNKVEVRVKSASGETKEYVINITRNDNRGSNNDLAEVIINSGQIKINFDKDVLEYRIKTYKQTKIDVTATPVDSKATVKVKAPEKIEIGENKFTIEVTSEDEKVKTYKIVFDNQDREIDLTLSDIEISGPNGSLELSPKFQSSIKDYELRYDKSYAEKDGLSIIPIINSKVDDVKYDEDLLDKTIKDIKPGSKIEIRVYAPDGTESFYTIKITEDNRINFFTILFGVILLILLVIFIKLFINRNKVKDPIEDVKVYKKESEKELVKTKRLNKINLE